MQKIMGFLFIFLLNVISIAPVYASQLVQLVPTRRNK